MCVQHRTQVRLFANRCRWQPRIQLLSQSVGPICATFIPLTCGNSSCLNGGLCLIVGNRTICQCPPMFTGARCEVLSNPCDSKWTHSTSAALIHHASLPGQPCVNGGTCSVVNIGRKKRQLSSGIGFLCFCLNTYGGARCESFLSLCGSYPCLNNGTCYQDFATNTVRCSCPPNFTGALCSIPTNGTNICTANPLICFNGGICRVNASLPLGFSCICTPTTTGLYCEQQINTCLANPLPVCANNGTCVS